MKQKWTVQLLRKSDEPPAAGGVAEDTIPDPPIIPDIDLSTLGADDRVVSVKESDVKNWQKGATQNSQRASELQTENAQQKELIAQLQAQSAGRQAAQDFLGTQAQPATPELSLELRIAQARGYDIEDPAVQQWVADQKEIVDRSIEAKMQSATAPLLERQANDNIAKVRTALSPTAKIAYDQAIKEMSPADLHQLSDPTFAANIGAMLEGQVQMAARQAEPVTPHLSSGPSGGAPSSDLPSGVTDEMIARYKSEDPGIARMSREDAGRFIAAALTGKVSFPDYQ